MLLKDIVTSKVEKECNRTNLANSTWFNGLISTGQFYNSLTKKRKVERPNETKEMSIASSREAVHADGNQNMQRQPQQQKFVNVAHMIYDYKQAKGGDQKKHEMKRSLQ